jgi:hypothetical protein
MKTRIRLFVLAALLTALPVVLQAQPTAHYVPGSEGLKGASLPPPGFYVRDYNYFYWSDQFNSPSGHDTHTPNFEAFTYANIPRVIWITDKEIFKGFLGVDALLPLVYQHLDLPGYHSEQFGVGDLFVEGTISWHPKQFDFAIASGIWTPTGESTRGGPSTRAGSGYCTFMQTAGATWYIDGDKTWAFSLLNRYEFNTKQRYTQATPGQAYTLEWGLSKTLGKVFDVGVVGYYQRQVTGDSSGGVLDSVAAIGPEISVVFPKQMFFVSARYNYEYMAESRAQGNGLTLTLTKAF